MGIQEQIHRRWKRGGCSSSFEPQHFTQRTFLVQHLGCPEHRARHFQPDLIAPRQHLVANRLVVREIDDRLEMRDHGPPGQQIVEPSQSESAIGRTGLDGSIALRRLTVNDSKDERRQLQQITVPQQAAVRIRKSECHH